MQKRESGLLWVHANGTGSHLYARVDLMNIKKRDRVQFRCADGIEFGTVFKGGAKPHVFVDGSLGMVSGPANLFSLTDNQFEYEKCDTDKRITAKVKQNTFRSTKGKIAFNFTFYLDNKAVAELSDDADGGPMSFGMLKGHSDKESEFKLLMENWFEFHFDLPESMSFYNEGCEKFENNLLLLANWLVDYAWLPVTPKFAINDQINEMIAQ